MAITEKEKMIAGLSYNPADPKLIYKECSL